MPTYDEPGLFDVTEPPAPPANTTPRPSDDEQGPPSPPVPSYASIAATVGHHAPHPLLTDGPRDGDTYDDEQDRGRLNGQQRRVLDAMRDNQWHTLPALAAYTGDPQASVSARLRDLRKHRFGGRVIERRRVEGGNGLHEYRLDPDKRQPEPVPDLTLPHAVQLAAEEGSYIGDDSREAVDPPLVVLTCRQCPWRYELPEGSTVQDAYDALARHPRKDPAA